MGRIGLAHDGWIVVADGKKALFLYNEGDALYPNLKVFREMAQENPPSRKQGRDRPGRYANLGGPISAVDSTDWHKIEEVRFAAEVSDRLYRYAHAGRFQRLMLVAPPNVLADLRKVLHREVADRVIAEIPKDLTRHSVGEIEAALLR